MVQLCQVSPSKARDDGCQDQQRSPHGSDHGVHHGAGMHQNHDGRHVEGPHLKAAPQYGKMPPLFGHVEFMASILFNINSKTCTLNRKIWGITLNPRRFCPTFQGRRNICFADPRHKRPDQHDGRPSCSVSSNLSNRMPPFHHRRRCWNQREYSRKSETFQIN